MAKKDKKWIQKGNKHPGSLTKIAKKAGETPMQFAREHYRSKGKVGQKARFAVNANKGK